MTKYRQREGWSHLDLLRLAHANPGADPARRFVLRYVAKGLAAAVDDLQQAGPAADVAAFDEERQG